MQVTDLAVELHLLAHVPVQHARDHALPRLHQRIDHAAGARIDGADGRHFAERRIARVGQRHQVGQGDLHAARRGLGIARAHPVAHLVQQCDQLSAFHVRAFHVAVTSVLKPPRAAKSPITVALTGLVAATTSCSTRLTTFS